MTQNKSKYLEDMFDWINIKGINYSAFKDCENKLVNAIIAEDSHLEYDLNDCDRMELKYWQTIVLSEYLQQPMFLGVLHNAKDIIADVVKNYALNNDALNIVKDHVVVASKSREHGLKSSFDSDVYFGLTFKYNSHAHVLTAGLYQDKNGIAVVKDIIASNIKSEYSDKWTGGKSFLYSIYEGDISFKIEYLSLFEKDSKSRNMNLHCYESEDKSSSKQYNVQWIKGSKSGTGEMYVIYTRDHPKYIQPFSEMYVDNIAKLIDVKL